MPEEDEPEDLFEGEEYHQQTDPRDKSRMSPDRMESPLHNDMADQIEEELDLLRFIRSHHSKAEIELRLDANGAFSPRDAMRKLERLAAFDCIGRATFFL